MQIKFKDVAHLYLGGAYCNREGFETPGLFNIDDLNEIICNEKTRQIILRPIASITKPEAMEIMHLVIHVNVRYPESDCQFYINDYGNPAIRINNDWYDEKLVIGKTTGAVWSLDKPSSRVKVPASA